MWYKYSNRYFGEIENFGYGEINKRSFSNPHPRTVPADQDGEITGKPYPQIWEM